MSDLRASPAMKLNTSIMKAEVSAPAQNFSSTIINDRSALSGTLLSLKRDSHSFLVQILISVLCVSQLSVTLDQCLPIRNGTR